MENRPYSRLIPFLSTVSVKALNSASRLILANNLDRKQILVSEKGFARDYRGFAELTGFPYRIIKKFEESEDHTLKILKAWETRPDATLDKLINNLEIMDRYDVIEDFVPSLREMFQTYIGYQNSLLENIRFPEGCDAYDAYVCYADEDSSIAGEIVQRLESPRIGLKLLKRGRDMLAECSNFELIKNKCRFMVVLLTANFMKSPALEFLVSFAGSLDIEQEQSSLISVILDHSEISLVLNNVPMVDFSKEYKKVWKDLMWDSLILSLLPPASDTIMSSAGKKIRIWNPYLMAQKFSLQIFCSAVPKQNIKVGYYREESKYRVLSTDDQFLENNRFRYQPADQPNSHIQFNKPVKVEISIPQGKQV